MLRIKVANHCVRMYLKVCVCICVYVPVCVCVCVCVCVFGGLLEKNKTVRDDFIGLRSGCLPCISVICWKTISPSIS